MPTLSAETVAGVIAAGGAVPPGTTRAQWVAKAREESSFDPHAVSSTGCCIGLWQINEAAHRDLMPANEDDKRDWLTSPVNNWKMARQVYRIQGWQAWAASGGAPDVTDADRQAAGNPKDVRTDGSVIGTALEVGLGTSGIPGGAGLAAVAGGDIDPLSALGDLVDLLADVANAVTEWITNRDNWVRTAQVVGGGALAVGALVLVAKPALLRQATTGLPGTK